MLILAFESSAKPASAAICSNGALLGQYFQNCGLTHSRTLLAMAESLLKNLEAPVTDVDLVAVASGPGSFTGVRIGVSAAKGLAWGLDRPVCGVSTLEAMAWQTPFDGALLCPVMDARRGQVYNALFLRRGGRPERLCEDRAISLEALADDLRERGHLLTTHTAAPFGDGSGDRHADDLRERGRVLLVGDGAAMCHEYLTAEGIACDIAPEPLRYQSAYGVALAAQGAEHIPAIALEPCYLRPSQAERERTNSEISRPEG